MIKLHLTYTARTQRNAKATGKAFTSLTIKATEYGDKFLSGFGNKDNESWKEGMEVEVAEVKEVVKDGKTYLNFEMPKHEKAGADILEAIRQINFKIDKITPYIAEIHALLKEKTTEDNIVDYPMPEDIGLDPENLANFDPHNA